MFPNREPDPGNPAWSETKWFGCWNPDEAAGLLVHLGRFRHDRSLWWIQAVAFLPNGLVAVDRSWGRTADHDSVTSGVFDMRGDADAVTACFDGPAEVVTTAELTAHPRGSGPSVPMRWHVDAERVRPAWSPFEGGGESAAWAGDAHRQWHFRVRGTLRVDGRDVSLDGPGFGDQSAGTRTWEGFGSHAFVSVPLPELGVIAISVNDRSGATVRTVGALLGDDGRQEPVTGLDMPGVEGFETESSPLPLVLHTATGTRRWSAEPLAVLPATITEDNDNINGLSWGSGGDPLFLTEVLVRITTDDGRVGCGHLERSVRRSDLVDRPSRMRAAS